ncbi:proline-rich protein 36-like [Brienomyrus brachyistius]|uniref:proline-rich protein 36-like n=1 Tax=Brienomyrus brachyistius TaxID=42636 RepID=UPI0020B35ADC|nr:proline-rich protein 36-like [Brienomyrus brachyistius]
MRQVPEDCVWPFGPLSELPEVPRTPPPDLSGDSQPPSKTRTRRKKKRGRERSSEAPAIFLGAVSLSSLPECSQEPFPILDSAAFVPARIEPERTIASSAQRLADHLFTLQGLYWRVMEEPATQDSPEAVQLATQLQRDFAKFSPASPQGDLERLGEGLRRLLQLWRAPPPAAPGELEVPAMPTVPAAPPELQVPATPTVPAAPPEQPPLPRPAAPPTAPEATPPPAAAAVPEALPPSKASFLRLHLLCPRSCRLCPRPLCLRRLLQLRPRSLCLHL